MGKITIKNMSFDYNGKEVFENLNLEIDKKWKTAVVARNGKGKTTLLKLIHGSLEVKKGEILDNGKTLYFPFEIRDSNLRVYDLLLDMIGDFRIWEKKIDILLSIGTEDAIKDYGEIEEKYREAGGYEIEAMIKKELRTLKLDENILSKTYKVLSGGEKTKLMLAALFLKKSDYILIDEPCNNLDLEGREQVAEYLKLKDGFMVVSHDRYFLDRVGDHILNIDKYETTVAAVRYFNWEKACEMKEESELKKNEELRKEIRKMSRSMREKVKWSNSKEAQKYKKREEGKKINRGHIGKKAARIMKRAKDIENRLQRSIDDKKSLLKNYEKTYELKFEDNRKSQKTIFRIDNLEISYGNEKIVDKFSLEVKRGDRVALVGANGSGKTSIFRALLGLSDYKGTIYKHPNVEFGTVDQIFEEDFDYLLDYLRVKEISEEEFRGILACLGVKDNIFMKKLDEFSDGERRKIQIAEAMLDSVAVLLWDEPLNYLDIYTRKNIEKAILKYKPTMFFIEHDRYFVEKVASRIIYL